jgi:hypothetical protein
MTKFFKILIVLIILNVIIAIVLSFLIGKVVKIENRLVIDERRMDKLEARMDAITLTYDQYRILKCESQFNPNAVGDKDLKYQVYGIAQFQIRTFNWLAKKFGFIGDINNTEDQVKLFKLAIDNGYSYLWSCSKKI